MGAVANISRDAFPAQGEFAGKRVKIVFHYNAEESIEGTCVRHDSEQPHEKIFRLDDGRFVRASECQYQPIDGAALSAPRTTAVLERLMAEVDGLGPQAAYNLVVERLGKHAAALEAGL